MSTLGDCLNHAKQIQQTEADVQEFNIYYVSTYLDIVGGEVK
ncbi:hypothetical protein [cyanobacterium endosymbiont of Epithemia clementina EcSB]|nr:hypothetical protein [cyanobacterium endosymbiont of Epithemia clementina EcSB]WGT67559.1 hypothetical protein P3F56_00130 [cyanobacterium endosymbiont of Epithemia clementina EcSB]